MVGWKVTISETLPEPKLDYYSARERVAELINQSTELKSVRLSNTDWIITT